MSGMTTVQDFDWGRLGQDAEWAAECAVFDNGRFKSAAVNWGNFGLVSLDEVIPHRGSTLVFDEAHALLAFEEASPQGNEEVAEYIRAQLAKRG